MYVCTIIYPISYLWTFKEHCQCMRVCVCILHILYFLPEQMWRNRTALSKDASLLKDLNLIKLSPVKMRLTYLPTNSASTHDLINSSKWCFKSKWNHFLFPSPQLFSLSLIHSCFKISGLLITFSPILTCILR